MAASAKARKVAKAVIEKGHSVGKAMRDAGYSKTYANNPQSFKKKKSWQELLDKYLQPEKIAQVHAAQLDAEDGYGEPDNAARLRAVDMAYKLRGSYAPEQTTVVMRKFGEMTDEELDAAVEEAERKLRKKD